MVNKSLGLKVLILPLSLAIVAFIGVFWIQPEIKTILDKKEAITKGYQQLDEAKAQTEKLIALQKDLDSLEEAKLIRTALPEEEAAQDYLDELYKRAVRSGVAVTIFGESSESSSTQSDICSAVSPSTADDADVGAKTPATDASSAAATLAANGVKEVPSCIRSSSIRVTAKGNWSQTLDFLKYLTDSNRITNISGVSLKPNPENGDLLDIGVTLDIFSNPKNNNANVTTLASLAAGKGFNSDSIKKIKDIIYAPYEPPVVSETGERNIFK